MHSRQNARADPALAARAVIEGVRSLHDRVNSGETMKLPSLLQLGALIQRALTFAETAAWSSGADSRHARRTTGLMAWQIAAAETLMHDRLDRSVSTVDLAAITNLSVSHFARGFRISMGLSPMKYLMRLRVERAQVLLRETSEPLSHIALDCGFSDQAHFSRVFGAAIGVSPGRWRRSEAQARTATQAWTAVN